MRLPLPADLLAILRLGLSRSLVSMLIKVATAGLTYLTYVALSRAMPVEDYGHFAFGLALATIVAVAAGLGQQTAILRVWSEEQVRGRNDLATTALRTGSALTLGGSLAVALLLMLTIWLVRTFTGIGGESYLYASAALILPLALAEFQSSALRAQGSVWTALAPRDLLWRMALPAAAVLLAVAGITLSGPGALLLAAGLLLIALLVQFAWARIRNYRLSPGFAGLQTYWRERGTMSRWFLFGALVDTAALNADTLVVGLLLDPESAGIYFNAFRTAGLMTLFTYAATLVIAPMLARAYHAGNMREAQAITLGSAWSGFLFSLVAFAGFILFGRQILSIFGAEYAGGWPVLAVLSIGLLVDAATGSSRTTMMMTGHERAYVLIFGATTLLALLLGFLVIPAYGLLGAAVLNSGARILAQATIAWWCVSRIGIDPSIFGALRINRVPRRVLS